MIDVGHFTQFWLVQQNLKFLFPKVTLFMVLFRDGSIWGLCTTPVTTPIWEGLHATAAQPPFNKVAHNSHQTPFTEGYITTLCNTLSEWVAHTTPFQRDLHATHTTPNAVGDSLQPTNNPSSVGVYNPMNTLIRGGVLNPMKAHFLMQLHRIPLQPPVQMELHTLENVFFCTHFDTSCSS